MAQPNSQNQTSSQAGQPGQTPPRTSGEMSFFEHADELRQRFMRALMVFMAGFVACYFVSDNFLAVLRKPLFDVLPEGQRKLYFTSLFENFMTHLKISGYASLLFLSPYFFWEIWQFVAPGLKERERKWVVPFVSVASIFFLGGASFAYFVLFPIGFKFFVTYGAPSDVPLLTIDNYYGTCLKLMLLFGMSFELPVFIVLMGALGLVDAATLRAHRRTAILIITVAAALFAPPDAVSMLLLGGPLVLMFEGSIWVVQWIGAKRKAAAATGKDAANPDEPSNPFEGKSQP
jgi:sec-independent protein translocase protein TatC